MQPGATVPISIGLPASVDNAKKAGRSSRPPRALRLIKKLKRYVAATLLLAAIPANAQTATDGDTLKHNSRTYRLWGIDAPEGKQACPDGWNAG